MVGYVIVGGMLFQRLEGEHGRAVDDDLQRVKDKHVLWLWNLTAAMNVLHPLNWSTTAIDVLDSYTIQVQRQLSLLPLLICHIPSHFCRTKGRGLEVSWRQK